MVISHKLVIREYHIGIIPGVNEVIPVNTSSTLGQFILDVYIRRTLLYLINYY
jgi:hypothetical protein